MLMHPWAGQFEVAIALHASTDWRGAHTSYRTKAQLRTSMSATSHDAIPEFPGKVLRIDAPAPAPRPRPRLHRRPRGRDHERARLRRRGGRPPLPPPSRIAVRLKRSRKASPALITSGSVLRERYVLETQLGNGGTATVFRAVDLRRDASSADGHRVAIKLLRPELRDRPQNIARLQREFRQTQAIAHPNVVRFHDLDCERGSWFIVMELLTGETLGPCLRRASPQGLPEAEALRIAVAVGEALAHAHAHGITHGDIKPDNIYLTTSGDVRLLDFGVAPESMVSAAQGDVPATPVAAAATRVYASPEVLAGDDPEPRDDVFSLSCVIYEMLAGLASLWPARRRHRAAGPCHACAGRISRWPAPGGAGGSAGPVARRPALHAGADASAAGRIAATCIARSDCRRTGGRGEAGRHRAAPRTETIAARVAERDRCRHCARDGHPDRPLQCGTRAGRRRTRVTAGSRSPRQRPSRRKVRRQPAWRGKLRPRRRRRPKSHRFKPACRPGSSRLTRPG